MLIFKTFSLRLKGVSFFLRSIAADLQLMEFCAAAESGCSLAAGERPSWRTSLLVLKCAAELFFPIHPSPSFETGDLSSRCCFQAHRKRLRVEGSKTKHTLPIVTLCFDCLNTFFPHFTRFKLKTAHQEVADLMSASCPSCTCAVY